MNKMFFFHIREIILSSYHHTEVSEFKYRNCYYFTSIQSYFYYFLV